MKAFTASELLNVWEQGLNRSMLQRVLIVLGAAHPDCEQLDMARLSIGERDDLLMELRARLFGTHMVNTVICPQCDEQIEWENSINDLRVPHSEHDREVVNDAHHLDISGYHVAFRLPNSADIAEVLDTESGDRAQQALLERCIIDAQIADKACDVSQLPPPVYTAVSQRIEELDPQAEVKIQLSCPGCAHEWSVVFDIAAFLWTEIEHWAERMLQTVHQLAHAYGWSESQILALTPIRRALYLQLVRS